MHGLSFGCHFAFSSSLFPPSSLKFRELLKKIQHGNIPFFFFFFFFLEFFFPYFLMCHCNHITSIWTYFICSEFSGTVLRDVVGLPCEVIFVSRLLKGNKSHLLCVLCDFRIHRKTEQSYKFHLGK